MLLVRPCVDTRVILPGKRSVAQIGRWPRPPFPQTNLSYGFRDGCAERGKSVLDSDVELQFGDLTVEFQGHEPLVQQFYIMYSHLDANSAVVSAPSPPVRAAEVFRCAQGLVSSHGSGGDGRSGLRILAGRDD